MTTFTEQLKRRAIELGFARTGVARAGVLEPERRQLRAFVEAGRHGTMDWLADTVEVRGDPAHPGMLPQVRSVLVLATPYARRGAERVGPAPGRVARYAHGRDYHNVIGKRLRKLVRWLRAEGHEARMSVDTMPVLERAWAERAGVGFVGKNCCLIVPGLGSHVFLSCVLTTAELDADAPLERKCGTCRLCLDACPTDAFAGPRELDARRCISYLTIEHSGPVPESLRAGMGDWVFGCDVCQDVCPYNRTDPADEDATAPFAPDGRFDRVTAEDLLTMERDTFDAWGRGSPVRRPGRDGMARNAATALGNAGDRRHLPVLRRAAAEHPSETVRETAAWAAERIDKGRE